MNSLYSLLKTKSKDYQIMYPLYIIGVFFIFGIAIVTDLPYAHNNSETLCPFHQITGYPCPGCGVGRGLIFLLHGHILEALVMNPFSLVMALLGSLSIVWMCKDLIRKRETYMPFMKRRWPWALQILLYVSLIVVWIWNIYRGI